MENRDLIPLEQFCTNYELELSFISSLQEFGLVEVYAVEEARFIPREQLANLEKMIRLHYEMDINIEGIEAIIHLLQKLEHLHQEVMELRNRLRRFEDD